MQEIDKNLDDAYVFWIERAVRALRKSKSKLFSELGVNVSVDQWVVLKRLNERQGQSQREIAESTFKDPASITRTLDVMVKRGFVERRANEADRRTFEIFLTIEGESLVNKVLEKAVAYRVTGLDGVSVKDLDHLKKTLNRISENLESS
ncbi:MAG: DNA-binding MarR family transcriptional regulator [Cyclobacteriaceae bacterium]|jgi:DNA-binding MarR family transcriptional regulator